MDIGNHFSFIGFAMKMLSEAALNDLVGEIVRKELAGDAIIDSVSVERDIDADGDPVFNVLVVFSSKSLDVQKAKSLARHLIPALEKKKQIGFPILSFRSKADHTRGRRNHARLSAAA